MKNYIRSLWGVVIVLIGLFISNIGISMAASADVTLNLNLDCMDSVNCNIPDANGVVVFQTGEKFSVEIYINNPSSQSLISTQSWLVYDPNVLEGVSLELSNNFGLAAPGEQEFDVENGRVKIGLANTSGGVTANEIDVAIVTFKIKDTNVKKTDIKFYDYQVSELGHTNVNILEDIFPINVLVAEPEGINIHISKQSINPPSNNPVNPIPDVGGNDSANEIPNYYPSATLDRPVNVRITTGNSYAYLTWDGSQGLNYNIYYGNQSGTYMHKMEAGTVNSSYVTNLTNNQTYYFAIKAQDNNKNESDYSNEVAVMINQPQSSTSPIGELITDLSKTKSGPSLIIFATLFSGSCGYIFTRKKK